MDGRIGRRAVLLGAGTAVASLLAGCSGSRRTRRVTEAVLEVEGVDGCELDSSISGTFQRLLHGRIDLGSDDRDVAFEIYDEAMRAVVTTLHDGDGDDGNITVGGIMGFIGGAEEFTVRGLDPDMPVEDYRLDRVTASTLYARYGLT